MVAQFTSESDTSVNTRLIPQIDFSIAIEDKTSAALYSDHTYHARIAKVEIRCARIEKNLIIASVARIFDHVYNAIVNDMNPDILSDPRYEPGTNHFYPPASIQISIGVDKTSDIPIINFHLIVENLKSEYVDDVLSRIKTYLLNAVLTDMNPT